MTTLHSPAAALEAARNHYAAALAAHDAIVDHYDAAHAAHDGPDPRFVAAMQDAVRFGLRAGELAASIAIASDLVDVAGETRSRLTANAPTTSNRVRMAAVPAPTPGHPDRCSCGQCGARECDGWDSCPNPAHGGRS
jgi:hypothetical protein